MQVRLTIYFILQSTPLYHIGQYEESFTGHFLCYSSNCCSGFTALPMSTP